MRFPKAIFIAICMLQLTGAWANKIFIPMDAHGQKNHLKAYGVAYAAMKEGIPVYWLLNYKGGSFAIDNTGGIEVLCRERGIDFKNISDKKYDEIARQINDPSFDGKIIKLEHAPRIAVYTPLNKEPWDDAVTMVLTYAGIPFDKIYADEVLAGDLDKYDWLHLHHEDFTGQYSKFWANYRNYPWYQNDKQTMEAMAARNGFKKVAQLQAEVVKKIRDFVGRGGNLFAMCSATETFDIALAAAGIDICDTPFDGDPPDPFANDKLDFNNCFAFKDFTVVTDPYSMAHSDIDFLRFVPDSLDYFVLLPSPAKKDPVSAMLCQNHTTKIKGFMGQTTAFRQDLLKPGVMVLAKNIPIKEDIYSKYTRVKYIHGNYGKGSWTFYGGHDPEDYKHLVGSRPTDLEKFPNSPGYRLILNNVLLHAVKKKTLPAAPVPSIAVGTVIAKNSQEPIADNVKMYPDPTNNSLMIVFTPKAGNTNEQIATVTLVDLSGAEVFNHSYNSTKVSVDLKDLPSGMYAVKINGVYLGKVVKE